MKARVKWAGDLTFVGHGPTEKAVVMDAGKGNGGLGIGASPLELLLLGAGGCASIDVVMILQKARQNITGCEVEVSGERAEEHPKRFLKMHLHFIVSGTALDEARVAHAVELSMTKYCSASATLAEGIPVTWDFEINN